MSSQTFEFGDSAGQECTVKATGRKQIAKARKIWDAADDEGTIQAPEARRIFGRPEHHTTMNLATAFALAGFHVA